MKRALPVAAFVLLGGLVAGLVLALTSGSSHPTSPATSVRAQLLPRDPQFGDTVVATLDVPATSPLPGRVDFRPYTVVSKKTSSGDGRLVVTYRLGCLDQPCVPHAKAKVFRFKPAVWPPLRVHSRLAAADAAHPIVRVPPPVAAPVHYRVSPTATGIVLLVLAAVLAVAGAVLLLRVGLMRVGAARPKAPPL
jgi:hypothetical protein